MFFNPEHLTPDLWGGACSAIALGFATTPLHHHQTDPDVLECARKATRAFSACNPNMRHLQAVFNTIELNDLSLAEERSKLKVEGLVHYFGGRVVKELPPTLPKQDGLYLLRHIQPSANDKAEERGHTSILIRQKERLMFFDPNLGLQLPSFSDFPTYSHLHLCWYRMHYGLSTPHFYHLQ